MTTGLRKDIRLPRVDSLHIQVLWAGEQIDLPGLVLHVATRDVSAHGFCASANLPLVEGRIFDVLIELKSHPQPYLLTAEVRWCKPDTEGGYAVGFVILDGMHTDIQAWAQHFS